MHTKALIFSPMSERMLPRSRRIIIIIIIVIGLGATLFRWGFENN